MSDAPARALSLSQERDWFLTQLAGPRIATVAWAARLAGPLDRGRLAAVLPETVHHTTVHLTGLGEQEIEETWLSTQREQAEAELSLTEDRLIRTRLVRFASDDHGLIVTAHRVALDQWGLARFVELLADAYRDGTPRAELGDCATNPEFRALAERQRRDCGAADFAAVARAWADHVGSLPVLELPADRNRASESTYEAGHFRCPLPPELVDSASALAERHGLAAEAVWRAGFAVLAHRYTQQDEFALGVGTAPADPWRDVAAPSGDVTVERVVVRRSDTFADLLRIRSSAPDRPIPLAKLMQVVDPPRDPSRHPVFQVSHAEYPPAGADFGAARVTASGFCSTGHTLLDLESWIDGQRDQRWWHAVYRRDLFHEATVERMSRHFQTLMGSLLSDPGRPVAEVDMIDEDERRLVVSGFNGTEVDYPDDATVTELFEAQVLRSPQARAVSCGGSHLTYAQLNIRANRVAHLLRSHGAGRGTLIGLCLERSPEYLPAVLGVLKSGGAYVPLDPAYPTERLDFMLEDTGAPFIVTQRHLLDRLDTDGKTVLVIDDEPSLRKQGEDNPQPVNTADDLTYIVYTSGSTGRPKGVETIHRGVVGLVVNTDILALDEDTHYLQISPLSFDASTLEIFGPLLNGGRVVLMPPGVPTPARVARTVVEQRVNTLWLVAPLAHLTIDTEPESLKGLRQFMIGGDVLSMPHVRRVREQYPHVGLVNGYGPTEVTAFSVSYKVGEVGSDWPSIPIGRPMHNTTAYVLDGVGAPAPVGVWGELYLGGPRVALGYHNRPDLNAERFLPDHLQPDTGARLYRTGDRARWLPGGDLQFQGRLDTQVKIDGLRVELGEIQSVIAEHPAVGAVVVTAPYVNGRRSLVAYLVPQDGGSLDVDAVRAEASRRLPGVMTPGHYVVLDTLPLTPNNKVDFAALPEPELASRVEYIPPQGHVQTLLAGIWQELLGVERVGAQDNFFTLGGHSLRAVAMLSAMGTELGVQLAVQQVFKTPTLEGLAGQIENEMLAAIPAARLRTMIGEL